MTSKTTSPVWIGCAGWSIPRAEADQLPGPGTHLERYAQVFHGVEINSSFYRPHRVTTYAKWARCVPDGFRFSVKLPKRITHELRLHAIDDALAQFAAEVAALGEHLGCILIQIPPGAAFDQAVATQAFAALRRTFPCMLACEARHPSWFEQDATALLSEFAVTRVIADPAKGQVGSHVPTTQERYYRLHGSPRMYYSAYANDYLAALAAEVRLQAQAHRHVWVVFDNTASGAAMRNALQLRQLLDHR